MATALKISFGESDDVSTMDVLAEEILDAIKARDSAALAEALCAFMDEHASAGDSDDSEDDSDEEESY